MTAWEVESLREELLIVQDGLRGLANLLAQTVLAAGVEDPTLNGLASRLLAEERREHGLRRRLVAELGGS